MRATWYVFGVVTLTACLRSSTPATGGDGDGMPHRDARDASVRLDSGADSAPTDAAADAETGSLEADASAPDATSERDASTSCRQHIIRGAGLATDDPTVGDYCDSVEVCVTGHDVAAVTETFPDAYCGQEGSCSGDADMGCCCDIPYGGIITEETRQKMCQASLLDAAESVQCWVYGP